MLPSSNQQRPNNGFDQTTPQPSLPGTGNLPLNNGYNNQNQPSLNGYQNENSFNPLITKNGYHQDTPSTSSASANNQKPTNGYNQNSSLSGDGYNHGNRQHESVNEEQPYYQSNQIDSHNEFQTSRGATNGNYPQTNQSSYQGSKQSRGYLPPLE